MPGLHGTPSCSCYKIRMYICQDCLVLPCVHATRLGCIYARIAWYYLVFPRDYNYIRPPKDDIYLVYLKWRKGLFCMNFLWCTVLPSYESAKLTNLTAISRIFMSHWFSSTPLAMSTRTPPPPLITWPSVRGRRKINVTVKFLKWQWDLLAWPIPSLATLYTLYKIRTQQPGGGDVSKPRHIAR